MTRRSLFSQPQNVLLMCGEPDYPSVFGKLPSEGGILMGIIGSIDPCLGYISEQKPDLSMLFDINPYVTDYLNFRLGAIGEQKTGAEYWENLIALLRDPSKENFARCIKRDETYCDELLEIIKHGGRFHLWDEQRVDNEIRCGWASPQRYKRITALTGQKKLRIFQEDICSKGFDIAYGAADKSGLPINLVHLSNVLRYTLPEQRKGLYRNLEKGIEREILGRNCRIIEYDGFKTELNRPEVYLSMLGDAIEFGRNFVDPTLQKPPHTCQ
ncbi:MAG: hypothetical protein JW727_05930 [Candidatus Aenigmarchaeota archaeon]|nr:hypothetical protein [Candidatus Aenigmarchaeota archaeon]